MKHILWHRILKYFLFFCLFYSVAMLSPLVVDDYLWGSLNLSSFQENVDYVLHYGNGRLLGNLTVLYLVQHPVIRSAVKALTFLLIGLFMTRIVDSVSGGENENIVFLLLIAMAPQLFAQTFSWTSGFCNYAPPILCSLYLAYSFLFSDRRQGWMDIIAVFLIGGGGELFAEHSAIINFTLVCGILAYCIYKKRNVMQASLCWVGTSLGLLTIFLIPRFFSITTGFDDYQKLNLGNLRVLLVSVAANTMQICQEYVGAIALWVVTSIMMLAHCKKQKRSHIIMAMLLTFPIYSGAFYVLTRCFSIKISTLMAILNVAITFGYLGLVLYVIVKMEKTRLRTLSLVLFFLGLFAVSPLLVVYPIGYRCLFHSYIVLAMLAAVNYADVFRASGSRRIDAAGCIAVLLAASLLVTYYRIYDIDKAKRDYITACMENQKQEILVPKIPSDYIHSHENLMIEDAYFYERPGDIDFVEVDYRTWLECR